MLGKKMIFIEALQSMGCLRARLTHVGFGLRVKANIVLCMQYI